MESTKISEKNIRVLTSNGKKEVTFPNRFIQYCNRLNKIFTESYDVESGDESETSDENDVSEITTTRGSSKDVKSVEEFLTKYSCGDLVDVEFLKNLSEESMKGMLLVSEDFGIKILSTLLCTKFVDGKAALDNIYEFLDIDSKNLKDVERAAFKTAMTSGIKIPESCVDAWPLLSTTPSSIYSKWKELNEEERKEEQDTRRSNKFDGLAFQSETITLISSSGDEFVANSKLACELSAHLRHFVNLSDRDSDNEDSDPEEESTTSQRIKLSTSTSSVLRVFMDYANLYEKNGSPSEFSVSDWESAFLLKIGDEVRSFCVYIFKEFHIHTHTHTHTRARAETRRNPEWD